jgi:hypothetical protein
MKFFNLLKSWWALEVKSMLERFNNALAKAAKENRFITIRFLECKHTKSNRPFASVFLLDFMENLHTKQQKSIIYDLIRGYY